MDDIITSLVHHCETRERDMKRSLTAQSFAAQEHQTPVQTRSFEDRHEAENPFGIPWGYHCSLQEVRPLVIPEGRISGFAAFASTNTVSKRRMDRTVDSCGGWIQDRSEERAKGACTNVPAWMIEYQRLFVDALDEKLTCHRQAVYTY